MVENNWDQRLGVWWIAEDHPNALAIAESPEGSFTYGELIASANQIVHALRSLGHGAGDIIGVLSPNGVLPIQIALACQQAGWNLILINSYLTADEIVTLLEHANAAALVVHAGHRDVVGGVHARRIRDLTTVLGFGDVPNAVRFDQLVAEQPTHAPADRVEGGMIAYSSGTTGKPKGIVRASLGRDPSQAAHESAIFGRAFDFRPFHGPQLVSTAMYHGGSYAYYMGALNVGHALVIMAKFDAEQSLSLIQKYGVRSAYMVPTQFNRLLQLPVQVRERYDVSSLHSVVHSAAPCPRATKQAMLDWWGPVIWETYGGMEGAATIAKPHRWLEKPGTVGRAVRGVKLFILDDDGNELGANKTGNIFFANDVGFSYHRDAELTEQAFSGKRFTIGDIGYVDGDGYLFIQDRAKDMIISGGVNIFPAEIEGVLLAHPGVADAAVIGIPDSDWGEQVLAVVQLREGIAPSDELAAELVAYCGTHLAAYKRPRRVEFRAELPRTEAGKLYKRQIRDEFWVDLDRQV